MTEQWDSRTKARIANGRIGKENEAIRARMLERQIREQETAGEVSAVRAALIEGKQGSFCDRSVDEIGGEARRRYPWQDR